MSFTGFTREQSSMILEQIIGDDSYVCVFNSPPDEYGTGFTEPSTANGYQRQKFGAIDTSIPGQVANKTILFLFESVNNGCGSAEYVGLSYSATPGHTVYLVAQLVSPISMDAGTVPLIRKHAFKIGLDKDVLEDYPT